jgi:8-oxo-dGTP pyrophosphatase MutT (NUDIX family)
MPRDTRYQAAIVSNRQILLVQHHHFSTGERYWIFPGGGQEPGETAEETVRREMREETGLQVAVERLLYESLWDKGGVYKSYRTYLCTPLAGQASAGYEPEPEAASVYEIAEARWFDLDSEQDWGEDLRSHWIAGDLRRIRSMINREKTG